jgi:hypothetical protein
VIRTPLVPRWADVGPVGALLPAIGTTFERRMRDLRRWAERFADLG